jgi:hypothetical protein
LMRAARARARSDRPQYLARLRRNVRQYLCRVAQSAHSGEQKRQILSCRRNCRNCIGFPSSWNIRLDCTPVVKAPRSRVRREGSAAAGQGVGIPQGARGRRPVGSAMWPRPRVTLPDTSRSRRDEGERTGRKNLFVIAKNCRQSREAEPAGSRWIHRSGRVNYRISEDFLAGRRRGGGSRNARRGVSSERRVVARISATSI